MAFFSYKPRLVLLFVSLQALSYFTIPVFGTPFDEDNVHVIWGVNNVKKYNNNTEMTLSLDTNSGSAFQSRESYLFGLIEMEIKLVQGFSAGTICTFYASSFGQNHDEVDFEFLGNATGQPYILHTNLFSNGTGSREIQIYLWFDPTEDFHTYSILWNPRHIAFLVDGIPIRDFKNHEADGLSFPNSQPMNVYGSIWDGDSWATMGGTVKIDWTWAPFIVSYQNFNPQACVPSKSSLVCNLPDGANYAWFNDELNKTQQTQLDWVKKNYVIYDYCQDTKRWPDGLPRECSLD